MAKERINPQVATTLADMDGGRIAERSTQDYPRNLWNSYKLGHYRFALAGMGIGGTIAAGIGLAVASLIPGLNVAVVPTVLAFAATGAFMGAEGFGEVGAAAASRAAGLAEKHARILDADAHGKGMLGASDDKLMFNGRGQHYEFPPERDKGKIFNWKSGLAGAAMLGTLGGLAGMGSAGMGPMATLAAGLSHIAGAGTLATGLTAVGVSAAAAPVLATAAIVGAIAFAAFGLTFGIERRVLKSVFNQTDANVQGKLTFKNGPDLGRAQSLETDAELAKHRQNRQHDIHDLTHAYNDRIVWGALAGRFKGFAGAVPGAALGAAVGAIVVGAVTLLTGGMALPMGLSALGVIGGFSATGGILGANVFAQSGTEAGAEATARAIDTEFEHNRALRAHGITPPKPKEPKGNWFNLKSAVTCGLIGAAVGVGIAVTFGPAIIGLVAEATGHAIAASVGTTIASSALVSGLIGTTYGLGSKPLHGMAKPFTAIYDKVSAHHDHQQQAEAKRQTGLLHLQPPAPAVNTQITPEEAALLSERLRSGNGRNFSQTLTTQQMQTAPQGLTTGV